MFSLMKKIIFKVLYLSDLFNNFRYKKAFQKIETLLYFEKFNFYFAAGALIGAVCTGAEFGAGASVVVASALGAASVAGAATA